MSPDWSEMRQLDGRGFLSDTPEPSGAWLSRYIHPDDQQRVMAAIRQAVETRRPFELEHRVVRADGTLGWTSSRAVPLLDEDGAIAEWIGAASDVTARREAGEALLASEARLAADLAGMRRLYDLHAKLSNETDLHAALDDITAAACDFTGTDRGCIQLVSDDGERLEMFAWRGYADDSPFIEHFRHEGSKAACDAARRHKARLIIEDVETFPPLAGTRDREVALAENIRATQSTPLVTRRGEMVGVLNNQFSEPHRPIDDELRLIDLLAWTASDFIERHRADAALRASEERQAFLLKLSDALRPLADPDEIVAAASEMLGRDLMVGRCGCGGVDAAGERLTVGRDWTDGSMPSLRGTHWMADAGLPLATAYRAGRAVILDDTLADARASGAEDAFHAAGGLRASLSVPLVNGGRVVAIFYAQQVPPRRWTPDEVEHVREVAGRTWAAVERARAEGALRESEALRRIALDSGRMGAWKWDLESRLIWGDASFLAMWGFPPSEDAQPLSLFTERMSAEGAAGMEVIVTRAIEADEEFDGQLEIITGPTVGHWVHWRGRADRSEPSTLYGVTFDVTEQKEAEAALRELNETLEQRVEDRTAELVVAHEGQRQVLAQLVNAEEAERRRISRELHDHFGQQITGLLLGLRALDHGTKASTRLRELQRLADDLARDIQGMAVELRPPALDNLGLAAALRGHLEEWGARHGVETDFHSSGFEGTRLPHDVETMLYRVTQEGLNNVLKHARAAGVSLVLERRRGGIRLILEDDGVGFDVEDTLATPEKAQRLGVRGMRERVALAGGDLEIESTPGRGTSLYVRVPEAGSESPAAPTQEARP